MDLEVSGALFAGGSDVGRCDLFASMLNFSGDAQERFQFGCDAGGIEVGFDRFDEGVVRVVSAEVFGGGGGVGELAEAALVARGDVGGDGLAIGAGERAGAAQESFG